MSIVRLIETDCTQSKFSPFGSPSRQVAVRSRIELLSRAISDGVNAGAIVRRF